MKIIVALCVALGLGFVWGRLMAPIPVPPEATALTEAPKPLEPTSQAKTNSPDAHVNKATDPVLRAATEEPATSAAEENEPEVSKEASSPNSEPETTPPESRAEAVATPRTNDLPQSRTPYGRGAPFSRRIARQFLGRYEGTLTYENPETHARFQMALTLDINNLREKTNFLILVPRNSTSGTKTFQNFRTNLLSTDADSGQLGITWKNEEKNQEFATFLQFFISEDSMSGFSSTVYGMDATSEWKAIGSVQAKKTR